MPNAVRRKTLAKACVVLLADTDTHEAMGRMVNALTSAKEFIDGGDGAVVIFDGAGTKWVPELESEEHRYHRIYTELADHIVGACSYCAKAFGVKDEIEASSEELLSDYKGHPSLHTFASDGYQVLTF
jgi:hypothetical protein